MSMRVWGSLLLLVAGCSFDGGGVTPGDTPPDATADAAAPDDDGGGLARMLRHDTAADFGAPTAVLGQTQIEAWGAVGPAPRAVGALLARGVNRRVFTDPDKAVWEAPPADGATSLLAPPFIVAPGTLALSATDWTVWLEGELWLEAGVHRWELSADDAAFVDIATSTGTFVRIADATYNAADTNGMSTTAVAGWYPIRIALSQGGGAANLDLRHRGPADADAVSLPAYRYRTAAPASLRGLLAQGFDDRRYLAPGTVALQPGSALAVDYGDRGPQTLGVRDGETFAVRWCGQVRIDVAGVYTFRLASDDGQRLVVDGNRVIDDWADNSLTRDAVVDLDIGWHDLAVDLRENTANASIDLRIAAGPDLVGAAIPGERVRPTLVRTARVSSGRRTEITTIPDNSMTGAIATFRFDGPSDAVVTAVDLTADLTHPRYADLEIALRAPGGREHRVVGQGQLPNPAGTLPIAYSTAGLAGVAATGSWQIIVRDLATNLAGSLGDATIAVHYRGGESPVATAASYESAVLDLGAVVGFDSATWTGRAPAGATVTLRARSCDAAEACAAEPWSAPLVAGAVPPITPRRFVQYRAELATSGDAVPALDTFELHYRLAN